MIAYVLRWRQASSDTDRQAITEEMLADSSVDGQAIVQALESGHSTKDWEAKRGRLELGSRVERRSQKEQGQERDAEALRLEEMQAVAAELVVPKPKAQLVLSDLAFAAGSHLMSKKAMRLPEGTHKMLKPGREEVHVPAAVNKYGDAGYMSKAKQVAVSSMPKWFHAGFEGVKKLNLVQSQVYECAMLSSVCDWEWNWEWEWD